MKIIFFVVLYSLICSCNNNDLKNQNGSFINDSAFISKLDEPQFVKNALISHNALIWQIEINDRIYMSIHDLTSEKYHIMMKEINCDNLNRFHIAINNNYWYSIPEYDSLQDDLIKLYDTTKTKHCFSSQLFKTYQKRFSDTLFQNSAVKNDKIKELENIVNQLNIFKNFSFDNSNQLKILKKLYLLTQVQMKRLNAYNQTLDNFHLLFELIDLFEIKTKTDFDIFSNRLNQKSESTNELIRNWENQNYAFLKQKISSIERDFHKQGIYYFYSDKDLRVFKLTIKHDNQKITLQNEYINKEYSWMFWNYPEKRIMY